MICVTISRPRVTEGEIEYVRSQKCNFALAHINFSSRKGRKGPTPGATKIGGEIWKNMTFFKLREIE